MPIESFYEMLVIDTPEKAERLMEAFRAAERRGPYVPEYDTRKELEEGERAMKEYFAKLKKDRETLEESLAKERAGLPTNNEKTEK